MRRMLDVMGCLRAMAGAALILAGCSLSLDTSVAGHTCGPDGGTCLPGYVCNAENQCVSASKAECSPACSSVEACVRQQCVPVCDGRACPAGTTCDNGVCNALPNASRGVAATKQLGAGCTSDADCTGEAPDGAPLYCMIPFGAHSSGFCTRDCRTDSECGSYAPKCQAYRSEAGDKSVHVCAAASFLACNVDSDCTDSGLVCGVYITGSTPGNTRSVSACRSAIAHGAASGAKCNAFDDAANPSPCTNGLCVQNSSGADDYVCTMSCSTDADCVSAGFPAMAGAMPVCASVTVGGRIEGEAYPYVRANVCVPRASINTPCSTSNTNAQCSADAPDCIAPTPTAAARCAPRCSDNLDSASLRCPTGYQCVQTGFDGHCVAQ